MPAKYASAFPERRHGLLALIAEDLRVRHPRVIIDRVMQERTTAAPATMLVVVPLPGLPAQRPVPAAIGDPAELLDVHVHQLPGCGHLVPDRRGPGACQMVCVRG